MANSTLTTIYVVRHGESLANALYETGEFGNATDFGDLQSPLSDLGRKQSHELSEKLKGVHIDAIFSSDLNRARETAEILAQDRGLHVHTEATIRERFFGSGQKDMTKEKRLSLEKALENLNDNEKLMYRYFPDGETGLEGVQRFNAFLMKVIPQYKGKTILVVNHGNIMRSFLVHYGFATYADLPSGTIENAGYFVIETDGTTHTLKELYKIHKGGKKDDAKK